MMRKFLLPLLLAFGALIAHAQPSADPAYPSRPITVVLGTVPGGSAEAEARHFFGHITANTGAQFVLVHKPGAGGTIGADFVAKAKPDGYTLLLADGNFTSAPGLLKTLPYDSAADFAPVTILFRLPTVLLVNAELPFGTAREYFAYAKANPGKINYASVSAGQRLNGVLLHRNAGVDVTIVDYKGTGAMLPDLLAGRVQATSLSPQSGLPHVKSGKLKVLGISSAARSKLMPELTPLADQGAKGYDYSSFVGILAPAGTPQVIVDKLNGWFAAAGQDPAIRRRMEGQLTEFSGYSPRQSADYLNTEIQTWRSVATQ